MLRLSRRELLIAGIGAVQLVAAADRPSPSLLVYAAASMSNVLEDVGAAYYRESGVQIRTSFAASSALARQIESGAPADVFISADREWLDYLEGRGLIDSDSRSNIAANRLVLVVETGATVQLKIAPGFALAAALGGQRLAIADPDSVPAGKYARTALENLKVWSSVEARLARAENVRAALAFVARGEAPLGIVYETDARIDPKVRIVDFFPEGTHPPIRYALALTRTARPQGRAFTAYLNGAAGQAVFRKYGFGPVH